MAIAVPKDALGRSLSARLQRKSRRLRKKLFLGEFQELGFDVHVRFHGPLGSDALDVFYGRLLPWLRDRSLDVGGLGGALPLLATDGFICAHAGSVSIQDRARVIDWLTEQKEVLSAEAGKLRDAWYSQ